MASTTVIWTALPAGATGALVRISLLPSLRLDPEGDLAMVASFPPLADWPQVVGAAQYAVRLGDGSTVEASRVDPPGGLDSALWAALVRPELRVRPPAPVDRTGNAVFSYPVQTLEETVRTSYGRVGVLSPFSAPSQQALGALLRQGRGETGGYLDLLVDPQAEAAAREDMRQRPPLPVRPGNGAAARFWAFHHQPPPEEFFDLNGADAPDFADYVDVHQALAALQSYPALLRAIGLVVDLEVPGDAVPPGIGTVAVDVHGAPAGLTSVAMATAYARAADSFAASPDPAAGGTARELVDAGYVVLDPEVFGSVHVDVEGAVFKGGQLLTSLLAATTDGAPRDEAALPALRSAGISLVRGARANVLSALFDRAKKLEAALPGPGTVFLEDVLRGFRLDVWDDRTGRWHGVLGRDGTYTVQAPDGGTLTRRFVDEAAIEPAVTTTATAPGSAPPPNADLYLHEAIARWDGWSLAAPRPGRPVHRSADPGRAADPDGTAGTAPTAVPLTTSFRPALAPVPTGSAPDDGAGSLPQLRFGRRYRLRLRAVDLTGNSLPVTDPGESHALPAEGGTPYLRFEPVPAPAVVLRSELPLASAGETLHRVVLRSANTDPSLDEAVTATPVERHLAPPRTSVQGAELHGVLDDPATGRLRGDAATFAEIAARDGAQLAGGAAPVAPQEQLVPPWLPDPLARGVALRDLPGVPPGTESVASATGPLAPAPFPRTFVERAVEPRFPVERVVRVPFDQSAWPAVPAFRLVAADAAALDPALDPAALDPATGIPRPSWDAASRALTVSLPKATTTTVTVSSFVEGEDLPLLGVWAWIREALQELSEQVGGRPDGAGELEVLGLDAQVLVERARTGGHWMITPGRTLTLVHAVQQPLGRPVLELQAARRSLDENAARLSGRLHVHGASTLQVDLLAGWSDRVNDLASPTGYRDVPVHGAVEQFRIEDPAAAGQVFAGGSPPRAVGRYDPGTDTVGFDEHASPVHHVGDTRHHLVRYSATSTSRFRQHFDPDAVVTRTGDDVLLSVPSSARPPAPAPAYVVPTFGWQRSTATAVRSSIRHGGGLRVYLDSTWWGSGEGELLGVVLWPASVAVPADNPTRGRMGAFVTGWGMDPVWPSEGVVGNPAVGDFLEAAASDAGVHLPELAAVGGPAGVDVVGHAVSWDAERGLWYANVVVQTATAYFPFLRMALARWQPASIPGAALSHVVLADVAQLAPDRAVLVTMDPWSPGTAQVIVSGPGYQLAEEFPLRPQTTVITVEVQTRVDGIDNDVLAWTAADPLQASVVPDGIAGAGTNLLWRGTVNLPADREPGTYRLRITETETWFGDPGPRHIVDRPTLVPRIVYAEHMPL